MTVNNINFSNINFPPIKTIKIFGLSNYEHEQILKSIKEIENKNIFYLDKKIISSKINSNKKVEKFFIFKKYPSKLEIKIEKTNFIAIIKKDNVNYYIGSNGNLIKTDNPQIELPFIFGEPDIKKFLEFKEIIDNSTLGFNKIKNLYYFKSERWDLETKEGLIIKFPSKQIESSINIFSMILKRKDFKNIKVIDFRHNNQIIIDEK